MKTVEDFLNFFKIKGERGELRKDQLEYLLIEFAKMHVKTALEAVANNDSILRMEQYSNDWYISKYEVIKSYPLET